MLFIFFICILGESNRVPYDLPEAESELVAGFIAEYSPVLFSLIIFTEYANIISVSMIIIILLLYLISSMIINIKFVGVL
jgi:NADH-quinone oxidoreductase subunit H